MRETAKLETTAMFELKLKYSAWNHMYVFKIKLLALNINTSYNLFGYKVSD